MAKRTVRPKPKPGKKAAKREPKRDNYVESKTEDFYIESLQTIRTALPEARRAFVEIVANAPDCPEAIEELATFLDSVGIHTGEPDYPSARGAQ